MVCSNLHHNLEHGGARTPFTTATGTRHANGAAIKFSIHNTDKGQTCAYKKGHSSLFQSFSTTYMLKSSMCQE